MSTAITDEMIQAACFAAYGVESDQNTNLWNLMARALEGAVAVKLPCDVHLPPNVFIRKGCALSTVLTGINARAHFSDAGATVFPNR